MNNMQLSRSQIVMDSLDRQNSSKMDPRLKEYKKKAMGQSSFTFYRATAHLYFEDFASGYLAIPDEWQRDQFKSWIQGDFHLQNAGFFGPKKALVFHLNDFDEAYRGYFYLDMLRLMTSLYLMGESLEEEINQDQIEKLTEKFVLSYKKGLKNKESDAQDLPKVLSKLKKKLLKKKDLNSMLDKWTLVKDGKRQFDLSLEKLDRVPATKKDQLIELLNQNYQIKELATRLYSGLGSLGVEKYYFLVEGKSDSLDDDRMFELKEQVLSNVVQSESDKIRYLQDFKNHAHRAQKGTNALLPIDTDYDIISTGTISYGIKEISPFKKGLETFKSKDDLEDYIKYLAIILAQSHLKSTLNDDRLDHESFKASVRDFFEAKKNLSKLVSLAKAYAMQVKEDYSIYKHKILYNE